MAASNAVKAVNIAICTIWIVRGNGTAGKSTGQRPVFDIPYRKIGREITRFEAEN
jgi:hypothetical protein